MFLPVCSFICECRHPCVLYVCAWSLSFVSACMYNIIDRETTAETTEKKSPKTQLLRGKKTLKYQAQVQAPQLLYLVICLGFWFKKKKSLYTLLFSFYKKSRSSKLRGERVIRIWRDSVNLLLSVCISAGRHDAEQAIKHNTQQQRGERLRTISICSILNESAPGHGVKLTTNQWYQWG